MPPTLSLLQIFRRNCLTYFLWILSWSVTLSKWTYKHSSWITPKVLDTSLVFKYEYSCEPPKENNGYFEICIEFESIQPRRPSLDFLCKSILGYEEPRNNCLQKAQATMNLILAVVEKGAKTSITLTDEMLNTEKSSFFIPERRIRK
ncbi:unnamed protein product [Eruca vesicaria subsp. sativa]|uniref:Uncharacterized protein n=1 Tax=Eruca vesicaria subsp. sativa TaxID=29727 RepID=A0ABC8JFK1_ERUVS|nr:unnamed protein product [Eruca vesicaria subsp. sativa]